MSPHDDTDSDSGSDSTKPIQQQAKEFLQNPALQGVDSEYKLLCVFAALQDETNESLVHCEKCQEELDKMTFSEEFIEAYHSKQANIRQDLVFSSISMGSQAVQQRWISLLSTVVHDVVPAVDSATSTDPETLNDVDKFPFYIANGVIYYEECDHNTTTEDFHE
jgi:hypothetical protein